MSTSTPLCGICTALESKYKCPVCGLRYCSLACYKQHQPLHTTTTTSPSSEDPPTTTTQQPRQQSPTHPPSQQPQDRPRPGTTHRRRIPPNNIDSTHFATDPDFLALLHRYPRLKIQLSAVYALTLEPGPEDLRTWWREALPGDAVPSTGQGGHSRGRGGGRGGRRGGRGRGRGGSGVGGDARTPAEGGRQHGVWTAEKGEKEALGVMRRMRMGNQNGGGSGGGGGGGGGGDKAEGLKEFVELCMLRFGSGESQREEEEGEGMME
ncbi:hypothetical protein D0863_01753 [Hortaea werneckii]|uniref:HIT-type domain-containing protein n=1 Tax=Hortaea werneckii TaxID=91943 RepID=A0A3M7EJM6_HORWE|nr:hypothetical protein D0863_01753 [Hortaea werneckii]